MLVLLVSQVCDCAAKLVNLDCEQENLLLEFNISIFGFESVLSLH